MDSKLKDLVARTNIDELVQPPPAGIDLNQPVQSTVATVIEPARSTTDPLQIHFATADIVGKLQEPHAGGGLRSFALVFLGGPALLFGALSIATAWSNPAVGVVRAVAVTLFGLAMIGFWPWLLLRGRRRARRGD
ncbi:hypothetical protein [Stenotrophomonas mori]|uniref:Transmembrane protein n=1 Tax=Stenotrophomonas mori TaxID=2871096 RepID=A0ABT0SDH4_9GAMM|nr:hypothetical protein [Stenotrophomonas mori]MCL7713128.1 hypothetical protein [Stenotrophomonas mori]